MGAQFTLLALFLLFPPRPTPNEPIAPTALLAIRLAGAAALAGAFYYGIRGVIDLGKNLTPLPTPRRTNTLVTHGVYGLVRHPIYSAILHGAFAWSAFRVSLAHLGGTAILFLFFAAKASREERWLSERHEGYREYCCRVKRFIPWIY